MHFIIYSKCRYYTGGLLELQACLDRSIPLCPICCDAAQMLLFCDIYHQQGTRLVISELKLAAEMLLLMEIVESESSIMAAM